MSLRIPVMPIKNTLKKEITKLFREKIPDMVSQNIQNALKKYQEAKNKEHEKTQKQIKELRENFSKHQSEKNDTIKREMN
jgi:predicted alpha/beta-fold hydrolase